MNGVQEHIQQLMLKNISSPSLYPSAHGHPSSHLTQSSSALRMTTQTTPQLHAFALALLYTICSQCGDLSHYESDSQYIEQSSSSIREQVNVAYGHPNLHMIPP